MSNPIADMFPAMPIKNNLWGITIRSSKYMPEDKMMFKHKDKVQLFDINTGRESNLMVYNSFTELNIVPIKSFNELTKEIVQ